MVTVTDVTRHIGVITKRLGRDGRVREENAVTLLVLRDTEGIKEVYVGGAERGIYGIVVYVV